MFIRLLIARPPTSSLCQPCWMLADDLTSMADERLSQTQHDQQGLSSWDWASQVAVSSWYQKDFPKNRQNFANSLSYWIFNLFPILATLKLFLLLLIFVDLKIIENVNEMRNHEKRLVKKWKKRKNISEYFT